jgi:glycine betaine/proline transport system ATP-binding protein
MAAVNAPAGEPVVELRGVWKVFGEHAAAALAEARAGASKADLLSRHGAVVGIADVSFTIGRGEVFCIMGLSGSGKSTLLRHINRLIEPTAGEISILGTDIGALDREELRRLRAERVGMVFQHMALFPHRTVRDNVAYPLEIRREPRSRRWAVSAEKLALVGLAGYEDRFPHELSGGMQQRVGLARALASDPEVLLMDEPFSALDPLIRRELQDQFLQLSRELGKTTLFVTHDLDEAIRVGSRIAIMKDGRFVQVGTAAEIVAQPADDYVRAFVRNVSRLRVLTAGSVMATGPAPSPDAPRVRAGDDLERVIDVAAGHDGDVAVVDDAGAVIGTIGKGRLLRALRDGR